MREHLDRAISALGRTPCGDASVMLFDRMDMLEQIWDMASCPGDSIVPAWGAQPEPSADGFTLLAMRGEEVVGQMTVRADYAPNRVSFTLDTVFVDATARKRGVATLLADTVISIISDAVASAEAEAPGAWEMFDPEFRGDTNEAGDHVMSRMSHALSERLEQYDHAPEP